LWETGGEILKRIRGLDEVTTIYAQSRRAEWPVQMEQSSICIGSRRLIFVSRARFARRADAQSIHRDTSREPNPPGKIASA
jgi:hypothetical protein